MTKRIKDVNDILVHYGKDALRQMVRDAESAFWKPAEIPEHRGNGRHDPETQESSPSTAIQATDADGSVLIRGDRVTFTFADRMYEVDALSRNRAPGALGVTIHAHRGDALFSSKIEMYHPKEVAQFVRSCAARIETEEDVVQSDVHRMHAKLKELQDKQIEEGKKPKPGRIVPPIRELDRRAAMELLTSPKLIENIVKHFSESGYVGEEMNLLTGYIACTSRLLSKPLHVLYQSSTAAGKTTLMKAAVGMMPPEVVFGYSAVSPKALQYMQERDMRHSIFLLEEDRRLDDQAREMIKLLKTEGRSSSMITIKDPQTGMMTAVDFFVEGPLAFLMTTTALSTDEEQSNRDLVCSADESKEQTGRILAMQRLVRTLEGRVILERKAELQKLHQNAQRLLRPLVVMNPYAPYMTFPEHAHRLRRDHEKYLGIIEAVTLLHQYQRPVRTRKKADGTLEEYIETTLEDIEAANRIAVFVLGRSLDECPAHTRGFLDQAAALVEAEAQKNGTGRDVVRLTARQLSEYTGLSISQVQRHLFKLAELEYVVSQWGKNSPFRQYEILYRPDAGAAGRFLPGIADVIELARRADSVRGQQLPHPGRRLPHGK